MRDMLRCWGVMGLALGLILAHPAWSAPLDSGALSGLEQRLRGGEFPNVHSVLVHQGGAMVAEWYFAGADERRGSALGTVSFGPETLHDVRSVTKSVVSLLFGIALSEGIIGSLEDPVLDYFPEYPDIKTPEKLQIRIRDLLSMTSGLHWDERTFSYTDERNSETAMDRAPDRYRFILSQSIDAKPGERFNYSGGDVALLAAIVARATNMPLEAYAARKLFGPLGITDFDWVEDGKGIAVAASGLRLRPRDMVKIGALVLRRGLWEGRQIVPQTWIDAATTIQTPAQGDPHCAIQYGYLWWLGMLCAGQRQTRLSFANGNGGQTIWIAPALDLIVVTTMGNYNIMAGDRAANEIIRAVVAATWERAGAAP